MPVTYVGSCPFNPEIERQNFERKQAEYKAAYRRTGDPLFLHEALLAYVAFLHAMGAEQPPDWLVKAFGDVVQKIRRKGTRKGKPAQAVKRFQARMRHVQRYRCVRDLCDQDHREDDAFKLAVAILEKKRVAAAWTTIRDSYRKVKRSIDRLGPRSEFFSLVVRSDPTVVPVLRTELPDGTILINGAPIGHRE